MTTLQSAGNCPVCTAPETSLNEDGTLYCHQCWNTSVPTCACGSTIDVTWGPDPFEDEIRGNDTPDWICRQCWESSWLEISLDTPSRIGYTDTMNIDHYLIRIDAVLDDMDADSDIPAHVLRDTYADLGKRCIAASVELANLGF